MAGGGEEQQRSRTGRAITWPPRGAVRAADIAERGSVSLTEKVRGWAAAEAGPGRLLPWVPVAFGAGIAIYFAADREPIAWVTAIIAVAFCVAAFAAECAAFRGYYAVTGVFVCLLESHE